MVLAWNTVMMRIVPTCQTALLQLVHRFTELFHHVEEVSSQILTSSFQIFLNIIDFFVWLETEPYLRKLIRFVAGQQSLDLMSFLKLGLV